MTDPQAVAALLIAIYAAGSAGWVLGRRRLRKELAGRQAADPPVVIVTQGKAKPATLKHGAIKLEPGDTLEVDLPVLDAEVDFIAHLKYRHVGCTPITIHTLTDVVCAERVGGLIRTYG